MAAAAATAASPAAAAAPAAVAVAPAAVAPADVAAAAPAEPIEYDDLIAAYDAALAAAGPAPTDAAVDELLVLLARRFRDGFTLAHYVVVMELEAADALARFAPLLTTPCAVARHAARCRNDAPTRGYDWGLVFGSPRRQRKW